MSESAPLIRSDENLEEKVEQVSQKVFEITLLPEEVIVKILSNLNRQSLGRAAQLSKQLNRISSDNDVWKNEYNKEVLKSDQNPEVVCYKDAVRKLQSVVTLAQMHADCLIPSLLQRIFRGEVLLPEFLRDILQNPSLSLGEKNESLRNYLNSPNQVCYLTLLGHLCCISPTPAYYLFELLLELGASPDYFASHCSVNGETIVGTHEQLTAALLEKNIDPSSEIFWNSDSAIQASVDNNDTVRTRLNLQYGGALSCEVKKRLEKNFEDEIKKLKEEIFFQDNKDLINRLNEIHTTSREGETFLDLGEKFLTADLALNDFLEKKIRETSHYNRNRKSFGRMMKSFLSEYARFTVAETDERIIHLYNEKNSISNFINAYRVRSLNGGETDKQMVAILYAMPRGMREEVLKVVRQQSENLPVLM